MFLKKGETGEPRTRVACYILALAEWKILHDMPRVSLRHEPAFRHAVFPLAALAGEHVVATLALAFNFAGGRDLEALGYTFARF